LLAGYYRIEKSVPAVHEAVATNINCKPSLSSVTGRNACCSSEADLLTSYDKGFMHEFITAKIGYQVTY
jgi:hypothetical protein